MGHSGQSASVSLILGVVLAAVGPVAGGEVVIAYPGQPHGFVFGQDGSPEATLKCFYDCDAFCRKHMPTKPVPLDGAIIKQVAVDRK
jgi:hypothetical protein